MYLRSVHLNRGGQGVRNLRMGSGKGRREQGKRSRADRKEGKGRNRPRVGSHTHHVRNPDKIRCLSVSELCSVCVRCVMQLYAKCTLTLESAYYNEKVAMWEPLIEPVEHTATESHRPWQVAIEVCIADTTL